MNALLAAGAASGNLWAWLGGGVSVSIVVAAIVKVGRWIGSVEDRLAHHDRALHRIGEALASDREGPHEEGSS